MRTTARMDKVDAVLLSYQIDTTPEVDGGLCGHLMKPDGHSYQAVVAGQFSSDACTCPGFVYRGGCKHIEALREIRRISRAGTSTKYPGPKASR